MRELLPGAVCRVRRALVLTLKRAYDTYGACAGQHAGLVRRLEGDAGKAEPGKPSGA